MTEHSDAEVATLISRAKEIACRYYQLTGKPLGISGEIAEQEAARLLGLSLFPARAASADAGRVNGGRTELIQIKGRAVDAKSKYVGRVPKIKLEPAFDFAVLVLLDRSNLDTIEIWEADYGAIRSRLTVPGSKSRNERGSMGISQFKSIARKVWPAP